MMYIALLVGTVVSFFLGYLWYGPFFGTLWNTGMGFSTEDIETRKTKNIQKIVTLNIVSQIITAAVAYNLLNLLGITTIIGAFEIMFLVWLGFSLPISLEPVLWDHKPWNIFFINVSYRIVSYLCIAIAIITIAH